MPPADSILDLVETLLRATEPSPAREYTPAGTATPVPSPSERPASVLPPDLAERIRAWQRDSRGSSNIAPSRGRGAPLGNQNARKHGFYSRLLSPGDQFLIEQAAQLHGLDQELALLRARLAAVLLTPHGYDFHLLLRALALINRLHNSQRRSRRDLARAVIVSSKSTSPGSPPPEQSPRQLSGPSRKVP